MVHDALIIASLTMSAAAFAFYMWHTRDERREFAERAKKAERIRRSMSMGGRIPRGGRY
jgi:hypothetical protein